MKKPEDGWQFAKPKRYLRELYRFIVQPSSKEIDMLFTTTVFVLAIVAFGLDAAFGKELFRKLYKLTHPKEANPPADPPSFIAGRSVAGRIPAALVLTATFAFMMNIATVHSLLGLMAKSAVMFVVLMIGFTAAVYVNRWWNPAEKAKKVIDTLDGLESGVIDPAKKAKDMMHSAGERVKEMAASVMGDGREVAPKPAGPAADGEASSAGTVAEDETPVPEESATPAVHENKEPTFDERLRNFNRR